MQGKDHAANRAPSAAATAGDGVSAPLPRISVRELLGDSNEAVLVHVDQEYRLRITSNGKLILTK